MRKNIYILNENEHYQFYIEEMQTQMFLNFNFYVLDIVYHQLSM